MPSPLDQKRRAVLREQELRNRKTLQYDNTLVAPRASEVYGAENVGNDFLRGFHSSMYGLSRGAALRDADFAERDGDQAAALTLRNRADLLQQDAANVAPRVGSHEDINGFGDTVDFLQQGFGTLLPTMAAPMAAGVSGTAVGAGIGSLIAPGPGTAIGGFIGGMLGGSAAAFPMEAGEQASSQYDNEFIRNNTTAEERIREQNIKGGQNASLEALFPTLLGGRLVGKPIGLLLKGANKEASKRVLRQAGKAEAKKEAGKGLRRTKAVGLESGTESITEGLQTVTGQASLSRLDPNRDTSGDYVEIIDSLILGALGGTSMSLATTLPGYAAEKLGDKAKAKGKDLVTRGRNAFIPDTETEELAAKTASPDDRGFIPDEANPPPRMTIDEAAEQAKDPGFIAFSKQRIETGFPKATEAEKLSLLDELIKGKEVTNKQTGDRKFIQMNRAVEDEQLESIIDELEGLGAARSRREKFDAEQRRKKLHEEAVRIIYASEGSVIEHIDQLDEQIAARPGLREKTALRKERESYIQSALAHAYQKNDSVVDKFNDQGFNEEEPTVLRRNLAGSTPGAPIEQPILAGKEGTELKRLVRDGYMTESQASDVEVRPLGDAIIAEDGSLQQESFGIRNWLKKQIAGKPTEKTEQYKADLAEIENNLENDKELQHVLNKYSRLTGIATITQEETSKFSQSLHMLQGKNKAKAKKELLAEQGIWIKLKNGKKALVIRDDVIAQSKKLLKNREQRPERQLLEGLSVYPGFDGVYAGEGSKELLLKKDVLIKLKEGKTAPGVRDDARIWKALKVEKLKTKGKSFKGNASKSEHASEKGTGDFVSEVQEETGAFETEEGVLDAVKKTEAKIQELEEQLAEHTSGGVWRNSLKNPGAAKKYYEIKDSIEKRIAAKKTTLFEQEKKAVRPGAQRGMTHTPDVKAGTQKPAKDKKKIIPSTKEEREAKKKANRKVANEKMKGLEKARAEVARRRLAAKRVSIKRLNKKELYSLVKKHNIKGVNTKSNKAALQKAVLNKLAPGGLQVTRIISGGQTGADIAGLRAGKVLGLETGGTAPQHFKTEGGNRPDLAKKYGLKEGGYDPKVFPKRTMKNVDDADVTIAFLYKPSPGTGKTIGYAQHGRWDYGSGKTMLTGKKPVLVIDGKNTNPAKSIREFLEATGATSVNIAGHKETSQPGLEKQVEAVLIEALGGPKAKGVAQPTTSRPSTPQAKPTSKVTVVQRFTRNSVNNDKESLYLFTDNANRTSGNNPIAKDSYYSETYGEGKRYPGMTQAVIRGLDNSRPISTMLNQYRGQWTAGTLDKFKATIDAEIAAIKEALPNFPGGLKVGPGVMGKGTYSKLPIAHQAYLDKKLAEIGINQGTPQTKSTSTLNVWAGTGENRGLSNLAIRRFTYKGKSYKSVEHAYQTWKSGEFDQTTYDAYNRSLKAKIRGKAADRTKNVGIMEEVMRASFMQNQAARKLLMDTGDATLTHTQDRGIWKTKFPEILTKIRSELQSGKTATVPPGGSTATITKAQAAKAGIMQMYYRDGMFGLKMRPEFKGKSTLELIKSGDRTATTRAQKPRYKVGDIIRVKDKAGNFAFIRVTKAPYSTTEVTAEQWSKLEGWAPQGYEKYKNSGWQMQYEHVTVDTAAVAGPAAKDSRPPGASDSMIRMHEEALKNIARMNPKQLKQAAAQTASIISSALFTPLKVLKQRELAAIQAKQETTESFIKLSIYERFKLGQSKPTKKNIWKALQATFNAKELALISLSDKPVREGLLGSYSFSTDSLELYPENISSISIAVWTAWHEFYHRGARIRYNQGDRVYSENPSAINLERTMTYSAEMKEVLTRASNNKIVDQIVAGMLTQRGLSGLLAVEEALVEIGAAIETKGWRYLEKRYGITATPGIKGELSKLVKDFIAVVRKILSRPSTGRYSTTDTEIFAIVQSFRVDAFKPNMYELHSNESLQSEATDIADQRIKDVDKLKMSDLVKRLRNARNKLKTARGSFVTGLNTEIASYEKAIAKKQAVIDRAKEDLTFSVAPSALKNFSKIQLQAKKALEAAGFTFQNHANSPGIDLLHTIASKMLTDPETTMSDVVFVEEASNALAIIAMHELGLDGVGGIQIAIEEFLSTGKRPKNFTLWDKVKDVIDRFLAFMSNEKYTTPIMLQVDKFLDRVSKRPDSFTFKPQLGKTKTDFQTLVNRNPITAQVFEILNNAGVPFALTGSMAYADQTSIYRNMNIPVHDIDLILQDEQALLDAFDALDTNFGSSEERYQINFDAAGQHSIRGVLFSPKGTTLVVKDTQWISIKGSNKPITNHKIVDSKTGKVVGTLTQIYNAKGDLVEKTTGAEAILIDLILAKHHRDFAKQEYTANGEKEYVQVSSYTDGFVAKMELLRNKDIRDIWGARPNPELKTSDKLVPNKDTAYRAAQAKRRRLKIIKDRVENKPDREFESWFAEAKADMRKLVRDEQHSEQKQKQARGKFKDVKSARAKNKALNARAEKAEKLVKKMLGKLLDNPIQWFLHGNSDEKTPGGAAWTDKDKGHFIRAAIDSMDPTSIVFHESMHILAKVLSTVKGGEAQYKKIMRMAMTPHIQKQLRALLADSPAAIEQLADPNEAIAYMFQFHATGQLQIQPAARNIFRQWAEAFAKLIGYVTQTAAAEEMFTAFIDGDMSTIPGVQDTIANLQHKRAVAALQSMSGPVGKAMSAVFRTPIDRLRKTKNEHLIKLAAKYFAEPKDGGSLGVIQMTAMAHGKYLNAFEAILQKHKATTKSTQAALRNLQSGKAETPMEKDIRGLFEEMFTYASTGKGAIKVLVTNKDGTKVWKPMQHTPNFFPRVWNTKAILENTDKLRTLLRNESKKAGKPLSDTEIKDFIDAIRKGDGIVDLGHVKSTLTPAFAAANPRTFDFINDSNAALFAEFQDRDMHQIVSKYIRQVVHRREHSRAFGPDGSGVQDLLDKAAEAGASGEEIKMAQNAIKAMDGTLGTENMSDLKRNVMVTAMTAVTFAVLPLALFSSLVDPLGVLVRTGSMKHAANTYVSSVKQIIADIRNTKTKGQELAELLGIIERETMLEVIGNTYNGMFMNQTLRKANAFFFKAIGLEQWTRGTRVGALNASLLYLRDNYNNQKVLDELDLQQGDINKAGIDLDAITDTDQRARVEQALFRMVDESILRPSSGTRPIWMSDIRFLLLGHLKQFTFTFHNTINKQVVKNFKDKRASGANYASAALTGAPLLAYVPIMIAADMVRDIVSGRNDDDDDDEPFSQTLFTGIQRSGIMGLGSFLLDMDRDYQYKNLPINTVLGPTIGKAYDLARTALDSDADFGNALADLAPGAALWKGHLDKK